MNYLLCTLTWIDDKNIMLEGGVVNNHDNKNQNCTSAQYSKMYKSKIV